MTTALITGARGFIARRLAPVLRAAGVRVIGVSRQAGPLPGCNAVYMAALGESLAPVFAAERIDAVIHAALDSSDHAYRTNVEGTRRWLAEAQAASATTQILLSSLSADAEARADYGRAKHVLEQDFLAAGQIVFRMGVVVGDGGMFARMVESARRYPVVPLLDGGKQLIYVLGIDFLCQVLRDTVLDGAGLRGRAWNLQQPTPYPLAEVITAIMDAYGFRRLLLPLPARPMVRLLRLFERQTLVRLPVTSTNVEGLIQQGRRVLPSDFARFGHAEEPLAELIRKARQEFTGD
ncbi:MAG: NAD dependent epimerase/dehydratase family protein [Chloroflexi bacterium ADurb.Bin325]|nr:MAG: NAD dependent epimerase/dehydratase family protein [Chloroflexi bacterium ADurb.Bin325]